MRAPQLDQDLFTHTYCRVCSAQLISQSQRVAHYEVACRRQQAAAAPSLGCCLLDLWARLRCCSQMHADARLEVERGCKPSEPEESQTRQQSAALPHAASSGRRLPRQEAPDRAGRRRGRRGQKQVLHAVQHVLHLRCGGAVALPGQNPRQEAEAAAGGAARHHWPRGVSRSPDELRGAAAPGVSAPAPPLGALLPAVQRLVQQPQHGAAALPGQEARQERRQGPPAGAAGPHPAHGPGGSSEAELQLRRLRRQAQLSGPVPRPPAGLQAPEQVSRTRRCSRCSRCSCSSRAGAGRREMFP
ncbi:unnamed protein product [Tetraodon nigroviridis]|uniref:(spotted green pufferfish) hypothetical protein n=1 Tax=Tetraodon nigroviridis TaxID=99883 RepID=Q4RGB1_TETNG|nr:unnamed protein product [Tetraodon nigroviridis]